MNINVIMFSKRVKSRSGSGPYTFFMALVEVSIPIYEYV